MREAEEKTRKGGEEIKKDSNGYEATAVASFSWGKLPGQKEGEEGEEEGEEKGEEGRRRGGVGADAREEDRQGEILSSQEEGGNQLSAIDAWAASFGSMGSGRDEAASRWRRRERRREKRRKRREREKRRRERRRD
eukprot:755821-Hanusia_phi.AAC.1